jgi:mutator protein MutT
MNIRVRPTIVLIEDNRLLVIKQRVTDTRKWSLPGGKLEPGETIEQCLIREMKEETGLEIKVKELLYITDRYRGMDTHIVHMSFLVERTGKKPGEFEWTHDDPSPSKSSTKIREIRLVPIDELTSLGFTPTFQRLVKDNFPGRGSYKGDYHTFYGETLPDGR